MWARTAAALVYVEINAEEWDAAVYVVRGLFPAFPSAPEETLIRATMKCIFQSDEKKTFLSLKFAIPNTTTADRDAVRLTEYFSTNGPLELLKNKNINFPTTKQKC